MLQLGSEDQKLNEIFLNDLQDYVDRRRIEYPAPVLMSKQVDLFRMYKSVQERGGYSVVAKENSWKFVFLDCTDATSYSSNTGYYTRLAYEKNLLDFDRGRENPFPRVFREDEERMKKRNLGSSTSGGGAGGIKGLSSNNFGTPQSPYSQSAADDNDTDSEIDPQELDSCLSFDYDNVGDVNQVPPDDQEEDREKWFEECEDRLRTMQKQYRLLHRFLTKIDRKLGVRTRFSLQQAHAVVLTNNNDTDSSAQNNDANDSTDSMEMPAVDAIDDKYEEEEEMERIELPAKKRSNSTEEESIVYERKTRRRSSNLNPDYTGSDFDETETEDTNSTVNNGQQKIKRRKRRRK